MVDWKGIFGGRRPDLTPAQIPAIVAAVATLLSAFGVYDLTTAQQNALVIVGGLAVALVVGDAKIRGDRNKADALTVAAGISAHGTAPPQTHLDAPADEGTEPSDLPTDAEEFAAPPPDDLSDEEPHEAATVESREQHSGLQG